MDIAIAIALGGEPIAPEECDYSSYSQLGLVCPCCRNPVYLVGGAKVKAYKRKGKDVAESFREKHFSHFQDKFKLTECENRTSWSSQQQELAEGIARRQRLEVFIGKIYEILQMSPLLLDLKYIPSLMNLKISEAIQNELKAQSVYLIIGKHFWNHLKVNRAVLISLLEDDQIYPHGLHSSKVKRITVEAFYFLISDKGEDVVRTLFWNAFYKQNQASIAKSIISLTNLSLEDASAVFDNFGLEIIDQIAKVPWMQGFNIHYEDKNHEQKSEFKQSSLGGYN